MAPKISRTLEAFIRCGFILTTKRSLYYILCMEKEKFMTSKITVTLLIPKDLYSSIRKYANREERSVGSWIRRSLAEFIVKNSKQLELDTIEKIPENL